MKTRETAKWSKERWDENERIERQTIFAKFSSVDEGRSRVPVARVLLQSPEWEANARLIAAAPELLEACKEFVRKVECGEAKSRKSYAQMKAAIAKAESSSSPACHV